MVDPIKIRVGDYQLIDNGNGVYNPEWDAGDRLVNDEGVLVSEKDEKVQQFLKEHGLDTFHGLRVREFADYVTVLRQEKVKLKSCGSEKECIEGYKKVQEAAIKSSVSANLESVLTKQLIETMGGNGYLVPLYFASSEATYGNVGGLDKALGMAKKLADASGVDATARIDSIKHKGYTKAIEQAHEHAEGYVEKKYSGWLANMNGSLNRVLDLLKATRLSGDLLFATKFIGKTVVAVEKTRKEGYRQHADGYLKVADGYITKAYSGWLQNMDGQLAAAENTATEGKVIGEFADRIIETRRKGYKQMVDGLVGQAIQYAERGHSGWLQNMNANLDQAITFVEAKLQDKTEHVFVAAAKKGMFAVIEAARKDGYRKDAQSYITQAEAYITKHYSGWLQNMDGQLAAAEKTAIKGKVIGKFASDIIKMRRKGYTRKVDDLIASAKSLIARRYSGWKTNASGELDRAVEFVKAKIPGKKEDVFSRAQQEKKLEEIAAVRTEIK